MITFSDEEIVLLSYIDGLIPEDGNLEFDFNDPLQYEAAEMILKKSFNTERFPGKLQALNLLKIDHLKNGFSSKMAVNANGWADKIAIPGLGLTSQQPINVIASNGIGTVVGGYSSINLTLVVQDKTTGNIVASGLNHDYAGKLLSVKTIVNTPGSSDTNVKASLYYSYTPTGSSNIVSGVIKRDNASGLTADPIITAPVRTTVNPLDPKAINIGIGRPWTSQGGSTGFDYAWNEPNSANPIGKIPFVGSVIFPQAIKPLVAGTTIILEVYVANQSGGGVATLNATNLTNVYANFSIDPVNPNKLNWSLPPGQFNPPPTPPYTGNPITFGNVTWPSNLEASFYCGITVVLQNGDLGFAAVQSQTATDDDPLDGILGIMPISFIWHCLGEKTSVIMADGSIKPISAILAGDKVKTDNDGGAAIVEWTNKGGHFGHVFIIKVENGHEIIASDDHVFLTEAGAVTASELSKGDILKTYDGSSAITAIQDIADYSGTLYNIATRSFQDPTRFDGNIIPFFANSFMVGDINAQNGLKKFRSNNIDWVKKQVPDFLIKDVESFFEDKAAGK